MLPVMTMTLELKRETYDGEHIQSQPGYSAVKRATLEKEGKKCSATVSGGPVTPLM
jgi:hypothetical protein